MARSTIPSSVPRVPQPATAMPLAERTGAAVGDRPERFAREDHQHATQRSSTYATLDAAGLATVVFTRTFAKEPTVGMTETDAAGKQPLIMTVQSWTKDASGAFDGCIIRGQRARMLPTINPLAGTITLVSALLSGVNGLIAALTNYNVFGGDVLGAKISVNALARTDV